MTDVEKEKRGIENRKQIKEKSPFLSKVEFVTDVNFKSLEFCLKYSKMRK